MKIENYPPKYKLSNLEDRSIINFFMRQPHKFIGRKYKNFKGDVLELGCGDGNNINYFKNYNTYTYSDKDWNFFNDKNDNLPKTKKILFDLEGGNYTSIENKYDLYLVFNVLEHVQDVHKVLRRLYNSMKPGAEMVLMQPNDPSFIWDIGEIFGSFIAPVDRRTYHYHQSREHINHIKQLHNMFKYYFPNVEISYLPMRVNIRSLNLFRVYTVKKI